jgi:hypothetical protein
MLKLTRKFSNVNVESVYLNHVISEKRNEFKSFVVGMALCAFLQILTHLLWWTESTFHTESNRLIGLSSSNPGKSLFKENFDILQKHKYTIQIITMKRKEE